MAKIGDLLQYIPVGERMSELFYANWMVVVSIGLLGAMEASIDSIVLVTIAAFFVNIIWGIIDGVTVMYGMVISRVERNSIVRRLQEGDSSARADAKRSLGDTIAASLDENDMDKVIDLISKSRQVEECRPRPLKSDIGYALGIVFLDFIMVFPLIVPLYLISDYHTAVYASHMISVMIFAVLGAAYARRLKRSLWKTAIMFAIMGTILATVVYEAGW